MADANVVATPAEFDVDNRNLATFSVSFMSFYMETGSHALCGQPEQALDLQGFENDGWQVTYYTD